MNMSEALRFPPFSRVPELVGMLGSIETDGGPQSQMAGYIAVAGYLIGVCWAGEPLAAGEAPRLAEGADWEAYGRTVADEVQGKGWRFGDLRAAIQYVTAEVGEGMSDLAEAQDSAGNS